MAPGWGGGGGTPGNSLWACAAQLSKSWPYFRPKILLFRSNSFGIETINTFIRSRSSLENHTRFQTRMGEVYTHFQTRKGSKGIPFGEAHTYMAYIREYPPPPTPIALGSNQKFEKIKHQLCWPNTNYLLDLVKRSVKFCFNSLAISEFISIITKTSKCSLVVVSQLVKVSIT